MKTNFLLFPLFFLLIGCISSPELPLPIYGAKEFDSSIDDDTIYHTIPNWSFTNQYGEQINSSNYEGEIHLVYFFFSHCPTICPAMTMNMVKVQQQLDISNVKFVSFTVDPIKDSSERLLWYQDAYGINGENWNLLTGNQNRIYELGIDGFLVPNQEDALAPGGFLHSEMIILVDTKGRIRGYYDGTDEDQIPIILNHIQRLKQE